MGPGSAGEKDAVSRDYVLVHGGMMSGGIWDEVASILRSRGHKVYCPTLADADTHVLEDDLEIVSKVIIDNDLHDVILAGHSFGGPVITGAYDRVPENVATLVFFDTACPESGKSLRDLMESYTPGSFDGAGVPAYRPFTDPLVFDEDRFNALPKIYANCKRSEFFESCSRQAFTKVINTSKQNNWDFFALNSTHLCMEDRPEDTAAILLGEFH